MTKKTFSWNLKDRQFYNLKAINKEILYKSYTRNFLKDNQTIKLIDNSSNIADLLLTKKESKNYRIGTSIKTKTAILRSIHWDKIQLVMPLLIKSKKKGLITKLKVNLLTFEKKFKKDLSDNKKNLKKLGQLKKRIFNFKFKKLKSKSKSKKILKLKKFLNLFKKMFKLKLNKKIEKLKNKVFIKKYPILIKKPIKGGFNVQSLGLSGFISKKQYNFAKKPEDLAKKLELEYSKLQESIPKKIKTKKFGKKRKKHKKRKFVLNFKKTIKKNINVKKKKNVSIKKEKNNLNRNTKFIILNKSYNILKKIKWNNIGKKLNKNKVGKRKNRFNIKNNNLKTKNNNNETKFNKKTNISSNSKK